MKFKRQTLFLLILIIFSFISSKEITVKAETIVSSLPLHKLKNEEKMLEVLSNSKIINIISNKDIDNRRNQSKNNLVNLKLTQDETNLFIEKVNTIDNLIEFDEFDNYFLELSNKNREIEELENKKYDGIPDFDENNRLIEVEKNSSELAEQVITLLLAIPGHKNGSDYHRNTGLDELIDKLSDAEAVHVIHRIEGPGFGQTGDGLAGQDSSLADQTFVKNQVERRFKNNIRLLLKKWGTFTYGGY